MVIAAVSRAPVHGGGRLLVDGTDLTVVRKAKFSISLTRAQEQSLLACLEATRELYNGGLQHRRDAYRVAGDQVGLYDQYAGDDGLTGIRHVRPDLYQWGVQPLRAALKRLDLAFQSFFDRIKAGETPGYPRFKGRSRFNTICWDEPACWELLADHRKVRIMGVGEVALPKGSVRQVRRMLARGGEPRTLTVTRRRAGGSRTRPRYVWHATVGFRDISIELDGGPMPEAVCGIDRGIAVTAAVAQASLDDAVADLLAMPAWMAQARDEIIHHQQARAGRRKGSRAWRAANRKVARAYSKAAQRADNWARETANRIVAGHGVVAIEHLNLKGMTRSTKGTVEEPSVNVNAKKALNRKLQDAALGKLAMRLCVKAESAGRRVWAVPAANTSRRCFACGHTDRANRTTQDRFRCVDCGHEANADINAARNIALAGEQAEKAWAAAGSPPLPRKKPRLRRRKPS